jgi:hypothetical protein
MRAYDLQTFRQFLVSEAAVGLVSALRRDPRRLVTLPIYALGRRIVCRSRVFISRVFVW